MTNVRDRMQQQCTCNHTPRVLTDLKLLGLHLHA